jgi:CheY-like chemotaxis protein
MPLKIMIVDDEPKTTRLMKAVATPLGHTVLTMRDYQAAGQTGEDQRFDAVFVPMRWPEEDGLQLARRIRNSDSNRNSVIVMLSATDDIESLRSALGEGADLVIPQSVSADRLRRMLTAMDAPEWKGKRHAARLPIFTEVVCRWNQQQFSLRSLNISESGMLLQPAVDVEVGQEVTLDFKIPEVDRPQIMRARIVRKEGAERFGVEFIDLAPEHQNAIQLYVTGRLKNASSNRGVSDVELRQLFRP